MYRVDDKGAVLWRVGDYKAFPYSTFTNVYIDKDGKLRGYNFDGVEYEIDLQTGEVRSSQLLK